MCRLTALNDITLWIHCNSTLVVQYSLAHDNVALVFGLWLNAMFRVGVNIVRDSSRLHRRSIDCHVVGKIQQNTSLNEKSRVTWHEKHANKGVKKDPSQKHIRLQGT